MTQSERGAGSTVSAFFERVRGVLDDRSMSQAELARALGVGEATVSEWFTRGRVPQGNIILKLPGVLGVNGHWLLTGEGPRRRAVGEEEAYRQGLDDVLGSLRAFVDEMERKHGGPEEG